MVDEGKIVFTVAVELSYLKEEEQYELHVIMDLEQCTPSLSQAYRLKVMSQHGILNMDEICMVLEGEKPNQREQIKLRSDSLAEIIRHAIKALELLISKVLFAAAKVAERIVDVVHEKVVEKEVPVSRKNAEQAVVVQEEIQLPKKPEEPLCCLSIQ